MSKYFVGTSGWIYKDWATRFYPEDIKRSDAKLVYFAKHFPTVEINNSFYRLPSEEAFTNWYQTAPKCFLFAVKLSRFLTHVKRLKPDERTNEGIDRFANRAKHLNNKLAVVLVQLPASFRASEEKIVNLAQEFKKAEKRHKQKFPLAIEARHDSWFNDEVYALLHKYNIANVNNSAPGIWPFSCEITADFAYVRFHGSKRLYSNSYSSSELENWADFIKKNTKNCKAVYCYFNNDKSARAVENAKYLKQLLG
jgi:uncharacterized protein YecE (DUF72 family)